MFGYWHGNGVCRLSSVTLVHATQTVKLFGNIFTRLTVCSICTWTSCLRILTKSPAIPQQLYKPTSRGLSAIAELLVSYCDCRFATPYNLNSILMSSLRRCNVDAYCHKHFVSCKQTTPLPAISDTNLPRFGAAVWITLGGRIVDNTRWSQIGWEWRFLSTPPAFDALVRGSPSEYCHNVW